MSVEQSGNVSAGHLARWIGTGILADGGPLPMAQRVIASAPQASFDSTADQPLVLPSFMTAFQLTGLIITRASLSLTVATGGFYPQASKAGSAIVAAGQVYSALTTNALLMQATLTTFGQTALFTRDNLPDWSIYFALTTGQPQSTTASIYAIGIDLS